MTTPKHAKEPSRCTMRGGGSCPNPSRHSTSVQCDRCGRFVDTAEYPEPPCLAARDHSRSWTYAVAHTAQDGSPCEADARFAFWGL